jgi:Phosphotransferase enzyme family
MDRTPPWIDHTVVAMALEGTGPDALLGMLMRDVGQLLLPEGDSVVELAWHRRFVDHLAGLGATFWGWRDEIGLCTMRERFRFFAPHNIAPELARPDTDRVLVAADQGWAALRRRTPELAEVAERVHARPGPLAVALARTPSTFLHGDWKMGNLGSHPDGRTILLDWAYPGAGPVCWDLAWYLALNRARLPESKEDTIEAFRVSLGGHGVDPSGWFDVQLGWWVEQALAGARLLDELEPGWR